jgi:Domain of unknown function (DUF4157)/Putative RNase-like toxin, toxin_1
LSYAPNVNERHSSSLTTSKRTNSYYNNQPTNKSRSNTTHYQAPISSIQDISKSIKSSSSTYSANNSDNNSLFQPKLKISQPGDVYEQEADRIAEQIVLSKESPSVPPDLRSNRKNDGLRIDRKLAQPRDPGVATRILGVINPDHSTGAALSTSFRKEMEPKLGLDLGGVRIHTGQTATSAAASFGAEAFTVGRNIFFNDQEYRPDTTEGKKLLAHELVHVIQQTGAVANNPWANRDPLLNSNNSFQQIIHRSERQISRKPGKAKRGHLEPAVQQGQEPSNELSMAADERYDLVICNPVTDTDEQFPNLTRDEAIEKVKAYIDVASEAYNKNRFVVTKERIKNDLYDSFYDSNREIDRYRARAQRALDSGNIKEAASEVYSAMRRIVYFDRDAKMYNQTVGQANQISLPDRSPQGFSLHHVDLGGDIEIDTLSYVDGKTTPTYYRVPSIEVAVKLFTEFDTKHVFPLLKAGRQNIDDVKNRFGETEGTKKMEGYIFTARRHFEEAHNTIFGKHGAVDMASLRFAEKEFMEAVLGIQCFDLAVTQYRSEKEDDAKFWHTVREVVKIAVIVVAGVATGGSAATLFLVMVGTEATLQAAEIKAGLRPKFGVDEIIFEGVKGAIHVPVLKFRNNLVEALMGMGASRNFATKIGAHVVSNYIAAKGNVNIGALINITAGKLMNQNVDVMTEVDKILFKMDMKELTIEAVALAVHPTKAHGGSKLKGAGEPGSPGRSASKTPTGGKGPEPSGQPHAASSITRGTKELDRTPTIQSREHHEVVLGKNGFELCSGPPCPNLAAVYKDELKANPGLNREYIRLKELRLKNPNDASLRIASQGLELELGKRKLRKDILKLIPEKNLKGQVKEILDEGIGIDRLKLEDLAESFKKAKTASERVLLIRNLEQEIASRMKKIEQGSVAHIKASNEKVRSSVDPGTHLEVGQAFGDLEVGRMRSKPLGVDVDEIKAVGEKGISNAEGMRRALDPGNREFKDFLGNRITKHTRTQTGPASMKPRTREKLKPVSVKKDPGAIFTRRFDEVTELKQIFDKALESLPPNYRSMKPTEVKAIINAEIREIIKKGSTKAGEKVRDAMQDAGFEWLPDKGLTAVK